MKRDTIFFDLDGTLLPLDMDHFVSQFKALIKEMDLKTPSGKRLSGNMLRRAFSYAISPKHPDMSNEDAFFAFIEKKTSIQRKQIEPLFDYFYQHHFDKLKAASHTEPRAKEIITILKEKGYRLVLATNPLFPKLATQKRLEWADINESDFEYITTFDNSRFSKPFLSYYTDVLDTLNLSAEQCIMVGNNVEEDLCTHDLGFDVFLLTDYIIGDIRKAPECEKGTYSDLKNWAKALPSV